MASAWNVSGQTENPLRKLSAGIAVRSFFVKEYLRSGSGHSDVGIAAPKVTINIRRSMEQEYTIQKYVGLGEILRNRLKDPPLGYL